MTPTVALIVVLLLGGMLFSLAYLVGRWTTGERRLFAAWYAGRLDNANLPAWQQGLYLVVTGILMALLFWALNTAMPSGMHGSAARRWGIAAVGGAIWVVCMAVYLYGRRVRPRSSR